MTEPEAATTDDLKAAVSIAKHAWRWAAAIAGSGVLASALMIAYSTHANASEVPALKKRLGDVELNVYFLCLMQEQADPGAKERVQLQLKIPVLCRPPRPEAP